MWAGKFTTTGRVFESSSKRGCQTRCRKKVPEKNGVNMCCANKRPETTAKGHTTKGEEGASWEKSRSVGGLVLRRFLTEREGR